jgi:hypothetical protein
LLRLFVGDSLALPTDEAISRIYFTANTSHPISADANPGYRFIGWQGEGITDKQAQQTTLSLTSDTTISVMFEKTDSETPSGPDLLA